MKAPRTWVHMYVWMCMSNRARFKVCEYACVYGCTNMLVCGCVEIYMCVRVRVKISMYCIVIMESTEKFSTWPRRKYPRSINHYILFYAFIPLFNTLAILFSNFLQSKEWVKKFLNKKRSFPLGWAKNFSAPCHILYQIKLT